MSRSLGRFVGILNCLATERSTASLAEIAEMTELDKSTAHRLLAALERQALVRRDPQTKRYSLGSTTMTWGASAFSSIEVRSVAEPVMLRLCSDTRESVSLWIRDGSRRICIATHDSPQPVRHVIQIGEQLPLTRGSGGKLTLALMPEPEALAVIHADSGLGDERRAQLIAELPSVRERGYGTSIQQMTANAWSMAAAIFDSRAREEPAATLVIAGPTGRLHADTIEGFAELLLPAAREVSKAMGAAGNASAGPALHGGSTRP